MPDRSAYVYERWRRGVPIKVLFRAPLALGFEFVSSENSLVDVFAESGESKLSLAEVEARILSGSTVAFQFWKGYGNSLFCKTRVLETIRVIEFDLKGHSSLWGDLRHELTSDFLSDTSCARFLGIVFDPHGATEDYDWDRFFIQREVLTPSDLNGRMPLSLLLKEPLDERLEGFCFEQLQGGTFDVSLPSESG